MAELGSTIVEENVNVVKSINSRSFFTHVIKIYPTNSNVNLSFCYTSNSRQMPFPTTTSLFQELIKMPYPAILSNGSAYYYGQLYVLGSSSTTLRFSYTYNRSINTSTYTSIGDIEDVKIL